ncbi:MAG: polysaccharide deacetylase family protein [Candidatus Sumerlaeaceae bacterium]|nr:polysaccharide deacetylase family protein [Candidatus Sumerlaeaceae bacterium]
MKLFAILGESLKSLGASLVCRDVSVVGFLALILVANYAWAEFEGPYVYAASDSFPAIARACGSSTEELLQLNHLTWESLRDGQVLRLPSNCASSSSGSHLRFFSPDSQMSREIWRGLRGGKRIALTFDAGGELGSAWELLDVLSSHHVPATFFVTGSFARRHPEWTKATVRAGHPIHNHSWSHPYFTKLPDADIRRELEQTEECLRELTGKTTRPYWRPPYGDRNSRVLKVAAQAGFRSVYWTLDSLDSYGDEKSPSFLIQRVTTAKSAAEGPAEFLDGAIILMHSNVHATVEALPEIIARLRQQGFSFVRLHELLAP